MRGWLLAVSCLTGCADVFGLTREDLPLDAAIDVPVIDAPECTLAKVTLPLVEDAEIIAQTPTQGHGLEPILNIGVAEALLKFDTTNLPPSTRKLTLVLPMVQVANDCGVPCGSCILIDRPGTIRAAFLRSDWAEATASYNLRSTGMPWLVVGANGASDRGPIQGAGPFVVATPFSMTFPATGIDAWVAPSAKRLSVVVSPFDGAVIIVRQHHAWAQPCTPVAEPPTLIADPCP